MVRGAPRSGGADGLDARGRRATRGAVARRLAEDPGNGRRPRGVLDPAEHRSVGWVCCCQRRKGHGTMEGVSQVWISSQYGSLTCCAIEEEPAYHHCFSVNEHINNSETPSSSYSQIISVYSRIMAAGACAYS